MDVKKIEKGVQLILEGIGEDPARPGLKDTPTRVAEMYGEIFSGIKADTAALLKPMAGESHDEMVMIRDIPFHSMCEHHLLPFSGHAHIAYIP
ncbi:MAG TPA: GTP cyclohydrolase I, partial [Nitrospirota bacterium]